MDIPGVVREFGTRTGSAIAANPPGERSLRDAGREQPYPGAASKTRRAAKGDPEVDGRVAAETGRTARGDRTATGSAPPARAPAGSAAETRCSGRTAFRRSKHC